MSRDALIVGINSYNHLQSLKSPAEDAEAVARLLEQYGEFHVRRLHAVKDESNPAGRMSRKMPVTVEDLEEALFTLFQPAGKSIPDTALFYFSGHGLRRDRRVYQEGYLATSDAKSSDNWGLSLQWIRRLLEESDVRQQVIWLDCCFGGELLNFDEANPGSRGKVRDRCFIAASRDFEAAYEDTAGSHGLLTGVLLEALDPSRNESEIITNYSLSDCISKHLRSAIQQPVFTNFGQPITLIRPDRTVKRGVAASDGVCPYKGLNYFDCNEEDPRHFFGRADLTDQLLEKVRESNFAAVLGPSGSGKTSVVRAGLLHQLQVGRRLSGSGAWPIRIFRPDEHPLRSLALSFLDPNTSAIDRADQLKKTEELIGDGAVGLDRLIRATANDGRVVLVADQFEESFTLCRDMKERQTFFECLLKALPLLEQKICLVITMRADFFSKCAEQAYSGLSALIQKHLVTVTPMTADELKEAITEPAKKSGSKVQSELISQMIEDVKDSPGSLPLLQYTLTELWDQREGDEMKLAAYTRMGGVKGTLARRADEVYETLSEQEQEIARRIFIELTQLGEGTEDTRRQVSKQGLFTSVETEPIVDEVIQKLADAKLIVTGRVQMKGAEDTTVPVVDVAHEALIRHWPRLRNWLDENRDEIRFQRRLDEAAQHWKSHKKAEGLLWRSPDLEMLEIFHDKHSRKMSVDQIEFFKVCINASNAAKREKEESRRRELEIERQLREKAEMLARAQEKVADQERISREKSEKLASEQEGKVRVQKKASLFLVGLITLMCIAAVLLYLYAGKQKEYAKQQKEYAKQQEENAQKQKDLKLRADRSLDNVQTLLAKNYWFNAINAKKENKSLRSLHFFANSGKKEKQTSNIKNCILNIQKNLNFVLTYIIKLGKIGGAVLNKDESRILTWSEDGTARLWHAKDGSPAVQPMKHERVVSGAVFSKDESRILTWSEDGTARLWHAKDGSPAAQPMKHEGSVNGAVFSKDESRILTWSKDGTARLWHAKDGSPAVQHMKHERVVSGAVFSKDENLILTWSWDGTARLWHAKDGSPAAQPMKHENSVSGAVFSKDESLILTWSWDGTARLWHAKDGSPAAQPIKHENSAYVNGAVFSKDESLILTWSWDRTARLWHAKDGSPAAQPMKHEKYVSGAVFSKDESLILTWSYDGTARLWHAKDGSPAAQPMKHEGSVNGAVFSKDESLILTRSEDGTARLWHAKDGSPAAQPMKHEGSVNGAVFSKDESLILTWSWGGTARLWHAKDDSPAAQPMKHERSINGAVFSKDESLILTWSYDGTARLWHAKDGFPTAQPMKHERSIDGAVFSKDESLILTWSKDGTARLWHVKDGSPAAQPMKHEGSVSGPVFSKDESLILTWSWDGTARLWRTKDGSPAAQPIKHENSAYVYGAVFNKDESLILTWSRDGTARLWHAKDGSPAVQLMKHESPLNGAVFSKDESLILTWSEDGTARLWHAKDGSPAAQPMKHEKYVSGAVFSKDESLILTWSKDGTARLWHAKDGSPAAQPMKHENSVNGAAFSKDEGRILTWSEDGTARLWHAKDGTPAAQPMKHESPLNGAVFSKDESLILTWSWDGTARLWRTKDGSPAAQPMKHERSVNGAVFSKDESLILTWSIDGTARLWDIGADYDFPNDHLSLLVEVVTGTVMDDYGNVTALSKEDWEKKKKEYIKIAEKHLTTCKYKNYNLYILETIPKRGISRL